MARNLHPVHSIPVKALNGLGAALRELRERRDLTQTELAKKAKLGQNQVSRYEREEELPSARSLSALLDGLGFDLYDLAHELDVVNGRTPMKLPGSPRADWVAALSRRGIDHDVLWGFALGAFDRGDATAQADFVASVEAAARELAKAALAEAERTARPAELEVAEPAPDRPAPPGKRRRPT